MLSAIIQQHSLVLYLKVFLLLKRDYTELNTILQSLSSAVLPLDTNV